MAFTRFPCPSRRARSRFAALTLAALAALMPAGCQPDEGVTAYDAPRPEAAPADAADGKYRILAVLVPQPSKTWFFKLVGLAGAVREREADFNAFVASLQFKEGKPAWTLPEGWREKPQPPDPPPGKAPPMVKPFAVLRHGTGDAGVELTVNDLPAGGDKQLPENVNRWRNQLGLKGVNREAMDPFVSVVKIDNIDARRVDLTGPSNPRATKAQMPVTRRRPPGEERSPVRLVAPEGWREIKEQDPRAAALGIRRAAAFEIQEGDAVAQVTIIPMPVQGFDPTANVQRWADQVGRPPLTDAELNQASQKIVVGDRPGLLVTLRGPGKAIGAEKPGPQAMFVVITSTKDRIWITKMTGPEALVMRQKPTFAKFIQTLQFEGGR